MIDSPVEALDAARLRPAGGQRTWVKVIDQTRCIGCHACSTACKSENDVPLSVNRTYVKAAEVGTFPLVRRTFQVTRCNQCDDAPCVTACPTAAMYRRPDGIVDFDKSICIGCKACIAACPYDAIFINPHDHSAEKCNFCSHRIDMGLEPACVVVCPTQAILVGDREDAGSGVAEAMRHGGVAVRKPEKKTRPRLFYRGAHRATLDPLAARRPDGGLFMWSEQGNVSHQVTSGVPANMWTGAGGGAGAHSGVGAHSAAGTNSAAGANSAAVLLAYDVPHRAPWDWRVGLYTWTKSIAAGVYLVALLLALAGRMAWSSPLWMWASPLAALFFLGATGAILIWDLEHPGRFPLIFLRPQWRSWIVRGAFAIAAYSLALVLHLGLGMAGFGAAQRALALVAAPLALLTAAYTAFLFAQAKARDLWQHRLLPLHFVVQAFLAGGAALLPLAAWLDHDAVRPLGWVLGLAAEAQILLIVLERMTPHHSEHARLAARELVRGRYGGFFRVGVTLVAIAALAPWIGVIAAPLALLGLLLHEHAHVQAAQAVPLA